MANNDARILDRYEAMAGKLEKHPGYRVLRRLMPKPAYAQPDGRPLLKGVIVDTETTGIRHGVDKIVELGMVAFEYDPEDGQVYRILSTYNAFDDPGIAIPAGTTKIHGITNDMVAGCAIDEAHVHALLEDATIVIAHHANFDRPFLEERLPAFKALPWACSLRQVNWLEEGLRSLKLDYIASQFGFFYDAHRVEADCLALLEALQHPLPVSGVKGLKRLLERYAVTEYRLWARGATFDSKEQLKERGYRWEAEEKGWHTTVKQAALQSEVEWLKTTVYSGQAVELDLEVLNATNRFSNRPGKKQSIGI